MNTRLLSRFRDDMQLQGLSVHTQQTYERRVRRFLDDTGYPKKPVSLHSLGTNEAESQSIQDTPTSSSTR